MSKKFTAVLILFLMTLAQVGTDIYLASFPFMKIELQTTTTLIQLTFSVFLCGFGASQLFYGPLADRFGRKPFLICGVCIYGLMSIVAAAIHSIEILLFARFIQGLGAGACSVIPRAIMRDVFKGKALEKMALSQSMVWSLIPITAPLLGSYIQYYSGWRFNFLLLGLIAIIALVLIIFSTETIVIKEPNFNLKTVFLDYKKILLQKKLFLHLACAVAAISTISAFNVAAPVLIEQLLKLTTLVYGWSIFFVAISFLIGTLINYFLMKYYQSETIVLIGICLISIAALQLFIFSQLNNFNLYELLLPITFLQIGVAFIFPSNAAKIMEFFPHKAGKVAAIFGSCAFLGATMISIIIAVLPEKSLTPLAITILLSVTAIIFFHYKILHLNHEEQLYEHNS